MCIVAIPIALVIFVNSMKLANKDDNCLDCFREKTTNNKKLCKGIPNSNIKVFSVSDSIFFFQARPYQNHKRILNIIPVLF